MDLRWIRETDSEFAKKTVNSKKNYEADSECIGDLQTDSEFVEKWSIPSEIVKKIVN